MPRNWQAALPELGFRLPTSPESGVASQAATPAVEKGGLRGLWLARERKRLGLSQYDVRSELRVHWNTLASIERRNRAIPAAWLPTLRRLKVNVGDALAAPSKTITAAAAPQAAAVPPTAPASPSKQPATSAPLMDDTAGLAQMIISYRLKYGRSAGQSPVEILAWLGHDLCQSGAA